MKRLLIYSMLLTSILISGCGGGGGSSAATNYPPVITGAEDRNATMNEQTSLSVNASDPDGTIEAYTWSIDDVVVSHDAAFSYAFDAGEHIVKVTVTDNDGASTIAKFIVDVKTYVRTSIIEAHDSNGALIKKFLYFYNSDGNKTKETVDMNGDGMLNRIIEWAFDENGHLISNTNDSNADGVPDYIFSAEYDGDYLHAQKYDYDGNGIVDNIIYFSYAQVLAEARSLCTLPGYPVTGIGEDTNADGHVDKFTYMIYDDMHRTVQVQYDHNGDGVLDARDYKSYDANGNLVMSYSDSHNNGVQSNIRRYVYDSDNNKILETHDSDGDGAIDWKEGFTYDTNGNNTLIVIDSDNDGTANSRTIFTYDENGNRLSTQRDNNGDGLVDYAYYYTFDAHGNLLSSAYDSAPLDGQMAFIYHYEYDEQNHLKSKTMDTNGDGITDIYYTITYGGSYPRPPKTNGADWLLFF